MEKPEITKEIEADQITTEKPPWCNKTIGDLLQLRGQKETHIEIVGLTVARKKRELDEAREKLRDDEIRLEKIDEALEKARAGKYSSEPVYLIPPDDIY